MLHIMRTVGMASLLERESKCSSKLPFCVTDIAMMPGIDGCHLRTGSCTNVLNSHTTKCESYLTQVTRMSLEKTRSLKKVSRTKFLSSATTTSSRR